MSHTLDKSPLLQSLMSSVTRNIARRTRQSLSCAVVWIVILKSPATMMVIVNLLIHVRVYPLPLLQQSRPKLSSPYLVYIVSTLPFHQIFVPIPISTPLQVGLTLLLIRLGILLYTMFWYLWSTTHSLASDTNTPSPS